jgi:hypothetical protein
MRVLSSPATGSRTWLCRSIPFLADPGATFSRAGCSRRFRSGFSELGDVEQLPAHCSFRVIAFPTGFAAAIHAKTEGSPLFMADSCATCATRAASSKQGGTWALAHSVSEVPQDLPSPCGA